MEDLRQTAWTYYMAATDEVKSFVYKFFKEMDREGSGHVSFEEFSKHMETNDLQHLASNKFFKELKQREKKDLYFEDVVTLFYIIYSGRPFCGGFCKNFVTGMYFTCVNCFFRDPKKAFSVCSRCFSKKKYEHRHSDFLDPLVLLRYYKEVEALTQVKKTSRNAGKPETSSSETQKFKYGRSTSSVTTVLMGPSPASTASSSSSSSYSPSSQSNKQNARNSSSNAIVPAVNQRSRQTKTQTAIQLGQLLANIGGIIIASQTCNIL